MRWVDFIIERIDSANLLPILLDAAIKGLAVLALTGLAALAMRRASAAARHLVWLLGTVSLLVLPVLSAALPGWHVLPRMPQLEGAGTPTLQASLPTVPAQPTPAPAAPVPSSFDAQHSGQGTADFGRVEPVGPGGQRPTHTATAASPAPAPAPAAALSAETPAPAAHPAGSAAPVRWAAWIVLIWLAGAAALLGRVMLGFFSLALLQRSSTRVTSGAWMELLQRLSAQLGLRRPVRLLTSSRRSMPMTWGLWRTRLLLPVDAGDWPAEQRQAVLLHELAHVKRWDCLTQLIFQLACALHWFNPLAWVAWRCMQTERERACDDLVLSTGAKASAYAEQLLQIAAEMAPIRFSAAAIAMARPSKLEGRLLAILDGGRNRKTVTWGAVALAVLLIGGLAVPLAMLKAGETEAQTVERQLRDAIEAKLKPVSLRYDRMDVRWAEDRQSAQVTFANAQELRGEGGQNVWRPIDGSLSVRQRGNGEWHVRGEGGLGHVDFAVQLKPVPATQATADSSAAAVSAAVGDYAEAANGATTAYRWRLTPSRALRPLSSLCVVRNGKPLGLISCGSGSFLTSDPWSLELKVTPGEKEFSLELTRYERDGHVSMNIPYRVPCPVPLARFETTSRKSPAIVSTDAKLVLWSGRWVRSDQTVADELALCVCVAPPEEAGYFVGGGEDPVERVEPLAMAKAGPSPLRLTQLDATVASFAVDVNSPVDVILRVNEGSGGPSWSSGPRHAAGRRSCTATVEASDQIPLEGGKLGPGFVYTVTDNGQEAVRFNIAQSGRGPVPAGKFVIRERKAVVEAGGTFTFADIVTDNGQKVPVSLSVKPAATQPTAEHPGEPHAAAQLLSAFLAAVKQEDFATAAQYVLPNSGLAQELTDFRGLPGVQELQLANVWADDAAALAVTTHLPGRTSIGDPGEPGFVSGIPEGPIVFRLRRQQDRWIITNGDTLAPEEAKAEADRFLQQHPGAHAIVAIDVQTETMPNIVSLIIQRFPIQLCFEDLDFDMARDSITLSQAVSDLESAEKKGALSPNEKARLEIARRMVEEGQPGTMSFDVGPRYTRHLEGGSAEELLNEATRQTPYTWRRIGNNYVIGPVAGSVLDFPVTLDTGGMTVFQAIRKIAEQAPAGQTISGMSAPVGMPVTPGVDPVPWQNAPAPTLRLNNVPAIEALCQITEQARPASVWNLAGYHGNRNLGLGPAPATQPAATQPTRAFPGRAAEQVVGDLKAQRLSFLSDAALKALGNDLSKFLASAPEPEPALAESILKSLHGYIPEYFPAKDAENVYLGFADRVATLEWKLWLALTRPPLSQDEVRQRAAQLQWLRDYINAVPEPDIVLRSTLKQPGELRADAIADLDARWCDPLDLVAEPLSNARWQELQRKLQPGGEWPERWGKQVFHQPADVIWPVAIAARDSLIMPHDDPTAPGGARFTVLQFPFSSDVVGVEYTGLAMNLHLRANSLFHGWRTDLHYLKGDHSSSIADVASYRYRNYPADPAAREKWFAEKHFGDVIIAPAGDALLAVRGAKIAPLTVADWFAADRLTDADLAAILDKQGAASASIADAPDRMQWMQTNGLKPIPPHFYVLRTAENRLSVLRLLNRDVGAAPACEIYIRMRPAAPAATQPAGSVPDAAVARTRKMLSGLESALSIFEVDAARYPSTKEGLAALVQRPAGMVEWLGPYIKGGRVPLDSWNHPFIYRCPGAQAKPFELLSAGPDGREGTPDDIGLDSAPAPIQPATQPAAVLDFRIAAQIGGEGDKLVENVVPPDLAARYIHDLEQNGPKAPVAEGFAWFEADDVKLANCISATHNGQRYILLMTAEPYTMLADESGRRAWGLKRVYVNRDGQDSENIEFEFDEPGGERFGRLTESNLRRPLAILVDGRVLSAPTIQSKITGSGIITGNFDRAAVKEMVSALTRGMPPARPETQPATQRSVRVTFHAPDAFAVELADGSEVRIRVDREKMARLGVTVEQLGEAIKSLAAKNAGELANAVIDAGNGRKVRLLDVATVEPGGR